MNNIAIYFPCFVIYNLLLLILIFFFPHTTELLFRLSVCAHTLDFIIHRWIGIITSFSQAELPGDYSAVELWVMGLPDK